MHPTPLRRAERAYRTFAWQGITVTVPQTWDLIAAHGKFDSGYVRLGDETAARLEIRWQSGGADQPPAAAADAYLARLRKSAAKSGRSISVQRDLNLASPQGKDVECYRWVGDRQSVAMVSRCAECGRTVHLHVLGRPQDRLRSLARTVFSSLRDHSDDGTLAWSFFDVEFRTPASLALTRNSFQAGCIRMEFTHGLAKLEFVRVSLAEILLAGRDLAGWFGAFYRKPLKRRSFKLEPTTVRGHEGIDVQGRVWLVCNPLRLAGRARVVRATCWHCPETNRLLICAFDGPRAGADVLEPAVESFRCCSAQDESRGA